MYGSLADGLTSPNNISAKELPDSCPGNPGQTIAFILGFIAQGIRTGPTEWTTTIVFGLALATA